MPNQLPPGKPPWRYLATRSPEDLPAFVELIDEEVRQRVSADKAVDDEKYAIEVSVAIVECVDVEDVHTEAEALTVVARIVEVAVGALLGQTETPTPSSQQVMTTTYDREPLPGDLKIALMDRVNKVVLPRGEEDK